MSCLLLLFASVLLHNCQHHAAPHGFYIFQIERLLIQRDSPAQQLSESQDERSAIAGIVLKRVILVLSGRPFWKFPSHATFSPGISEVAEDRIRPYTLCQGVSGCQYTSKECPPSEYALESNGALKC